MEDIDILLSIGLLIIALVGTLLALLIYSGLFALVDVKVSKPVIGKVFIAYKDAKGPFSNCGTYFSEATSIAPNNKQLGIYFDDPCTVPQENLRWAVGTILAEGEEKPDPVLMALYGKEGYQFMELPAVNASVNSVFPHTTSISILIAVKRVYPAMKAFIQTEGLQAYPFLEIYFDGKTFFMAPLMDQQKFYTQQMLVATEKLDNPDEPSDVLDSTPKSGHIPKEGHTDDDVIDRDGGQSSDESFEKIDANDDDE